MQLEHFLDLEADGVAGIERGHRVLEDHRDVLADDAPPLAAFQLEHVAPVELHARGADPAGGVDQAHQRHHGHRLAGTGFADDGQHFALVHVQVEAIHHRHGVVAAEAHREVVDFEEAHTAVSG
ncbi:hypothetical protein D9M71_682530 [compost metagenome]